MSDKELKEELNEEELDQVAGGVSVDPRILKAEKVGKGATRPEIATPGLAYTPVVGPATIPGVVKK